MFKLLGNKSNVSQDVARSSLPSNLSTDGPFGLQVLTEPENPLFDIVFVHGLTGSRSRTWTHPNETFWPKDLLADDIPEGRISTFGYDADVVKIWGLAPAGSNRLHDHGKSLAFAVANVRMDALAKIRPLIFVAHSLGGLVCEQALLVCRASNEPRLESVLHNTLGIIFMGTPHKGSDLADVGSRIARYLHKVRNVNKDLLRTLKTKSEVLASVQQDFQQMMLKPEHFGRIRIFCFYEEVSVSMIGKIVPSESAIMEQYSNASIHGDHMEMTKFPKRTDSGYLAVLGVLRDWIDTALLKMDLDKNKDIKLKDGDCDASILEATTETERTEVVQEGSDERAATEGKDAGQVEETQIATQARVKDESTISGVRKKLSDRGIGDTNISGGLNSNGGPLIIGSSITGSTFNWGK